MYSTTTLVKNSKFSGRVVGTHQRLDQAARLSLAKILAKNKYFPSSKEIIHFEGSRGPDGLKRKSPGTDEPSHMLVLNAAGEIQAAGQPASDPRSVIEMINDHRWNLTKALEHKNPTRAAFEAAWLAHMVTDGLTPAHHFPLSEVKDELMTDKEFVKVFGEPIKGVMHGRNTLETMRNNWLYWGAGGHMSKHVAYEYGVLMITTALTPRALMVNLSPADLQDLDAEQVFRRSLARVYGRKIYQRFLAEGWTTELAIETRDFLLPEIVCAITLNWYSAAAEAYGLGARKVKENCELDAGKPKKAHEPDMRKAKGKQE